MEIIATKKNTEDNIIFYYSDMLEKQALLRAKKEIRDIIKSRTGKRPYGWTFKVK